MREPNNQYQERLVLSFDHAEATADTTTKLWAPARKFKVDRAQYINPTGLAEHGTAFFAVKLLKAATVVASTSTDSAGTGDNGIVADTFMALTLSATATDLVFNAGDVMSLFLDRSAAAATLPAGRLVIEGKYL